MLRDRSWFLGSCGVALLSAQVAFGCDITDAERKQNPVEAQFCRSDAVFVGTVDSAIETIRAHTEAGSETTQHFRVQRSTVRVTDNFKEPIADKVTMVADLYSKEAAQVFALGKSYLIFAKRLPTASEYAGASASCALQPTALIEDAKEYLLRLAEHRSGKKPIACAGVSK